LSVYSLGEVPGSDGSGHHRRADGSPWYDVLESLYVTSNYIKTQSVESPHIFPVNGV